MNHDDDLDRALMALPLEEPPAGLRDAILRATVYAPPVASLALRGWEIVLVGTLLAVGAWLAFALAQDQLLSARVTAGLQSLVAALADPTTLGWLAAGVVATFCATFYNLIPRRVTVRSGRS